MARIATNGGARKGASFHDEDSGMTMQSFLRMEMGVPSSVRSADPWRTHNNP